MRECSLLLLACTVLVESALARAYLNCLTKKIVIVDASSGNTSSSTEESVGLWIDEAAKSLTLADGTPLIVRRFDDRWISAARGDVSYELDRQDGNLNYASSTTKDGVITIIIGSGRCKLSKVILFGERSLRRALSEYVEDYHAERNHQGRGNDRTNSGSAPAAARGC